MKTNALSLLAIPLMLVLVAGCVDLGGVMAKDCGDDMDCFTEQAKTCSPAKVVKEDSLTGMNMKATASILGGTLEECKVKIKIDKIDIDEEIADSMPKKVIDAMKEFEGKEMTCTVKASDVSGRNPLSPDESCEGSLVDLMEEWGASSPF